MKALLLLAQLLFLGNAFSDDIPLTISRHYNISFEGAMSFGLCSASLVRFDISHPTDKALVLSNGHCVGNLLPNAIVYRQPVQATAELFNREAISVDPVSIVEVIYATRTKTDLALLRLDETYLEIYHSRGVTPLLISRDYAKVGDQVDLLFGFHRRSQTCSIEDFVFKLREGDWIYEDSIRYDSNCKTSGGTSGSPILLSQSRIIVGVNNTGNMHGGKCTRGSACEIDEKGNITYEKGRNYGQQVSWLYTCLNGNREIDLSINGCALPKGQ